MPRSLRLLMSDQESKKVIMYQSREKIWEKIWCLKFSGQDFGPGEMSTYLRWLLLCWLTIAWPTFWASLPAASAATRPHILLIVTDDMGWMDLHCQGNPVLRTPHIDRLAEQGTRFTHAYAAAPVCSPTRAAALITGLAPARLQITQHGADGKQFWPTEQGFDINVGGCGLGGPPTYFDPYRIPALTPRRIGEYLTDRLADETITFLRREREQPMFVCLWTYNPHYPFEAPEELTKHYQGKQGPGLKNPIYGGQIEATDRAIGRVLQELEALEITEETLVIFTSDNGGWSGATDNRPLRQGKGYLYEGGLRVPLIIRWPSVTKAGVVDETPVVSMDLTATILDAADVALPQGERLDGESLRPLFHNGSLDRDALFFHYPHFAFHKANRGKCQRGPVQICLVQQQVDIAYD